MPTPLPVLISRPPRLPELLEPRIAPKPAFETAARRLCLKVPVPTTAVRPNWAALRACLITDTGPSWACVLACPNAERVANRKCGTDTLSDGDRGGRGAVGLGDATGKGCGVAVGGCDAILAVAGAAPAAGGSGATEDCAVNARRCWRISSISCICCFWKSANAFSCAVSAPAPGARASALASLSWVRARFDGFRNHFWHR
jgi:hypothetical protein